MGRPREDERLTKTTVWLRMAQRRALKVAAALADKGFSEVLREAVSEYLARHAKDTKAP